jgi:hypothetical protein
MRPVAPEIIALIDKPWLLLALLAIGAALGMGTERIAERMSKAQRRAAWEKRTAGKRRGGAAGSGRFGAQIAALGQGKAARPVPDAADQLRIVMDAPFEARALLNKPERRLLAHLDRALAEETPGWRAMGQVSLGEIVSSASKEAYLAVNSKRVDLLIVDAECRPLHAVEFQGTGHHQGTAAARDAVKKEALRRAGIGYVEVVSGDTPADVRAMVRKLAERAAKV